MNYELAKQLKEAGFPIKYRQYHDYEWVWDKNCSFRAYCKLCGYKNTVYSKIEPGSDITQELDGCEKAIEAFEYPTLSELIEACGGYITDIHFGDNGVYAKASRCHGRKYTRSGITAEDLMPTEYFLTVGRTPEEAVIKLWLELNKK